MGREGAGFLLYAFDWLLNNTDTHWDFSLQIKMVDLIPEKLGFFNF